VNYSIYAKIILDLNKKNKKQKVFNNRSFPKSKDCVQYNKNKVSEKFCWISFREFEF